MKVELHFEENLSRKDLPLRASEIAMAAKLFSRRMRLEPEWLECRELLGGHPKSSTALFCDDLVMRDYQKRYRKLDRTTDVLSFPAREAGPLPPGADDGARSIGDLVVSLEAIKRAAKRVRRPAREELLEVLIHGWLHLLGHDHIGSSARAVARARRMRALQRELLKSALKELKASR